MWRLIKTEIHDAYKNMALDEACLSHIHENKSKPTIRFYRWKPSAISIGYFQNLQREVDLNKCNDLGVSWVRRQTGGGAVYHDFEGELTYSVIAPVEMFPKNIIESYKEICGWIIQGLNNVGIKAEFIPINDIITNGKKISGNAQTRRKGILLQHGTILFKVDVKKMFDLLLIPDEKIRDKMIATVEERVTSVEHQNNNLAFSDIENSFYSSFLDGKDYKEEGWLDSEMEMANKLCDEKYGTRDWNYLR